VEKVEEKKRPYDRVSRPSTLEEFQKMASAKATHVAHLFGMSPEKLSRKCNADEIPGAFFDGVWYVTPTGMQQYIKQKEWQPQNKTRGGSRGKDDRRGKR
jgi:hypothetical protein